MKKSDQEKLIDQFMQNQKLIEESIDGFISRIKELEDGIRKHASQREDDRCWLDDLELYKLIGIDDHPGLKLSETEFLGNCKRYWTCQQTGETYKTKE